MKDAIKQAMEAAMRSRIPMLKILRDPQMPSYVKDCARCSIAAQSVILDVTILLNLFADPADAYPPKENRQYDVEAHQLAEYLTLVHIGLEEFIKTMKKGE